MGGGNTPGGVSPHPQGARLALRLVRQGDGPNYPVGNLCLETAFLFCCPPWQTKSCSELLTLWVRSPYMRNALRDTAMLRLDLPPPRAVLAGSPPDRGRAWWEPWACTQAGVSRQHESRPARTQGTLRLPKTPVGPRPV